MLSTATIIGGGNTALKTTPILTFKGFDIPLCAFSNSDQFNKKQHFLTRGHSA